MMRSNRFVDRLYKGFHSMIKFLGYFRKRVYLSCRPNQDIPFGQERVALQSGLNLPHRLLGE